MKKGENMADNNNEKPKKIVNVTIKQGGAAWMNTFADMMTLLLCFFVLLFAMSNIDAKKFEAVTVAFSGSAGILKGGNTVLDERVMNRGSVSEGATSMVMEMQSFQNMEADIMEYLEENNLQSKIDVLNDDAGLLLRFQENILFESGSAAINQDAYPILNYIGQMLNTNNFKDKFINVEGHTDNVPHMSARFPSNWELSVGRASSVVRYLIETMDINPERISASGYGEYHPVAPNDNAENRSKNRRVDIVILKSKDLLGSNYIQ